MECISINKEGAMLYQDKKGYEDYWRKHHVSPIARDIWMYTPGKEPQYRQLTTFGGEDREPVWAPDGKTFYYLSEENGSFNIYRRTPGDAKAVQLTHYPKNPVRYLSAATDGRLCYGFDGEIYTLLPGGEAQKVNISIVSDRNDKDIIRQIKSSGATEMAVSPDGKEVAFVLRGDVYVTSVEYKTTKQITNTPCQERTVDFAPDGRTLVYASERGGLWQLYTSTIVRKDEKLFTYATELKEERLTNSDAASFQPQYSPDGKEIAFLENRSTIRVINLKTKDVRTVMDGKYQYSYSDGDQWFQWSPDSKWILSDYIGVGGWNNKDVVLLNADGKGEMVNLTESGYNDGNAKWVLDGKAMIWESDRAGYRSHGSWGAESDVYIMFFDLEAYERFRLSKEEFALAIIDQYVAEKSELFYPIISDESTPPLERVKRCFETLLVAFDANNCSKGCLLGNLGQEMSEQSDNVRQRLEQSLQGWTIGLSGLLLQAQKEHTIHEDIDAEMLAENLIASFQGALLRSKVKKSPEPLRNFIHLYFDIFLIRKEEK